jgi:phospholipid/cholesterol/gamma-HCH transport system permease protein
MGVLAYASGGIARCFEYAGRMTALFITSLYYITRLAVSLPMTVYQMSVMGLNSLSIVFLVTSFTGMMLSLQVTKQALRFGTTRYIGGVVAIVMVRELVPVLASVVMAGRVGSAIASELGSMKVTEQIDALRSLATNPVRYLVVPRLLALIIMIPVITIFSGFVSMAAAYLVAKYVGDVTPRIFFESVPILVKGHDVISALVKSIVFAVIIALVGCTEGMWAEGGAQGVGRATTNAVVISMVLIFGFNYFLSLLLF